ncbi:MAG: flippase-like domain-containing protein [Acidobacteria bacterium]|nr:flippase-like domain-containing protein [Acidobacteriota bacterium]
MSSPAPSRTSPRAPLVGLVAALVGVALLVATIRQVGWVEIRQGVGAVGAWFLVVVALGGARFFARAKSWILCADQIGARGLTPGTAFDAVLAGDAVGNLTPLGLLASEPTKVLLVRRVLATSPALTSVALDNGFYTASVLVMIAAGAWALVRQVALDPSLRLVAEGVLAAVVAAVVVATWVALTRPAILSRLAQVTARIVGREARSPETLQEIEQRFYGVFAWPPAALWTAAAWQAAFHLGAVLEVWIVLRALSGGHTTLADAFVLESAGRLVTVLFKVIPFRMGVDEAGAAVVATALGIPPSHGVALALVRKLRILVWNACGLVVLARARR